MFNRHFVLLWQGQLISTVGSQMFGLALLYWMLETTGSASLMGLMLMAAALPAALLGPLGGTLADALPRKQLMIIADIVRGIAMIGFVVVLWLGNEDWWLPALFVTQTIFGLCGAVFNPTLRACTPDVVPPERLASANSLLQGSSAVTSALAMAAGGFLYTLVGVSIVFLFNGLSFLVSAVATAFITFPAAPSRAPITKANMMSRFLGDTAAGLRFVRGQSGLPSLLLIMSTLNCALVPAGLALPILVRDKLQLGADFLGVMGACQAVGTLLGFALAGTLRVPARHRTAVVCVGISAMGLLVAALGASATPVLSLVLVSLFGALLPIVNVNIITVIQGTTPSAVRGRVMGLVMTLTLGLMPFAQGVSGVLIDAVDQQVTTIYVAIGLLMPLVVCVGSSRRSYRTFMAREFGGN